jgi:hypothetical protein
VEKLVGAYRTGAEENQGEGADKLSGEFLGGAVHLVPPEGETAVYGKEVATCEWSVTWEAKRETVGVTMGRLPGDRPFDTSVPIAGNYGEAGVEVLRASSPETLRMTNLCWRL